MHLVKIHKKSSIVREPTDFASLTHPFIICFGKNIKKNWEVVPKQV